MQHYGDCSPLHILLVEVCSKHSLLKRVWVMLCSRVRQPGPQVPSSDHSVHAVGVVGQLRVVAVCAKDSATVG